MNVNLGISLPQDIHDRAQALADAEGASLSRLIDTALRAEILRRDLDEHSRMVNDAADTHTLRRKAAHRQLALRNWKDNQD